MLTIGAVLVLGDADINSIQPGQRVWLDNVILTLPNGQAAVSAATASILKVGKPGEQPGTLEVVIEGPSIPLAELQRKSGVNGVRVWLKQPRNRTAPLGF